MLTKYLHHEELHKPVRFAVCPFCKERVSSKGFVVTRTKKGYLMWCHKCHTKKFIRAEIPSASTVIKLTRDALTPLVETKQERVVKLPFDFTRTLPPQVKLWLDKYGVTDTEAAVICGWSPQYQRLILPVYNARGRLVYWTGRYFGVRPDQPKYLNTSLKKSSAVFDTASLSLYDCDPFVTVVVEDIISAMALYRAGFRAIALLGSYLDDTIITVLRQHRQVLMWLDSDKRSESVKFAKRLNAIGITSKSVLHKDGDPKDYSSTDIREVVYEKFKQNPQSVLEHANDLLQHPSTAQKCCTFRVQMLGSSTR